MDRRTAAAYGVLIVTTIVLASIAVVWFGPTSSLHGNPAFFGQSESVWTLFAVPILLTGLGLFGALGLASTRIFWTRLDELTPDAQRGLEQYRNTERRLFIGLGIIIAVVQLLVILSTAGYGVPFEIETRTALFVFGALLACVGNMTPKVPFFSRWWQINRAVYTKVSRFSGWSLMIGGVFVCLLTVFAPIESLTTSVSVVIGSMTGLVIGNALLHTLIAAKKQA